MRPAPSPNPTTRIYPVLEQASELETVLDILRHTPNPAASLGIYTALSILAERNGTPNIVHTSHEYLGNMIGMSRRQVQRYLEKFVELGLLRCEAGHYAANTYYLILPTRGIQNGTPRPPVRLVDMDDMGTMVASSMSTKGNSPLLVDSKDIKITNGVHQEDPSLVDMDDAENRIIDDSIIYIDSIVNIEEFIKKISQVFKDLSHLKANLTRINNIRKRKGLDEPTLISFASEAFKRTQTRLGAKGSSEIKTPISYFFSVLDRLILESLPAEFERGAVGLKIEEDPPVSGVPVNNSRDEIPLPNPPETLITQRQVIPPLKAYHKNAWSKVISDLRKNRPVLGSFLLATTLQYVDGHNWYALCRCKHVDWKDELEACLKKEVGDDQIILSFDLPLVLGE